MRATILVFGDSCLTPRQEVAIQFQSLDDGNALGAHKIEKLGIIVADKQPQLARRTRRERGCRRRGRGRRRLRCGRCLRGRRLAGRRRKGWLRRQHGDTLGIESVTCYIRQIVRIGRRRERACARGVQGRYAQGRHCRRWRRIPATAHGGDIGCDAAKRTTQDGAAAQAPFGRRRCLGCASPVACDAVAAVCWPSGVTSLSRAPGGRPRSGDVSCEFIRATISSCRHWFSIGQSILCNQS